MQSSAMHVFALHRRLLVQQTSNFESGMFVLVFSAVDSSGIELFLCGT